MWNFSNYQSGIETHHIGTSWQTHLGKAPNLRQSDKRIMMMKYIIISLAAFLFGNGLTAQTKFGNKWMMGLYGTLADFNSGTCVADTSNMLYSTTAFLPGKSNICDSNGNILLLCDGMNLYDKNGVYIEDGDTLLPEAYSVGQGNTNIYAQTSIILPLDSGIYYVVTPACSDSIYANVWPTYSWYDLMMYHRVDMKYNNGNGKVVNRAVLLESKARLAKTQMMACRHANGKDWWVLKMAQDSVNIHTYLFTQSGAENKGIQRFPFIRSEESDILGQMSFNLAGTKFASTCGLSSEVFLADFDRCSGKLSNHQKVVVPQTPWTTPWNTPYDSTTTGVCFSPNSQLLYVLRYSHVYQYNLQNASWYKVSGPDTNVSASNFQVYNTACIGPDSKIYIGNLHGTTKQMSVIDNPDIAGSGCNFCKRCFSNTAIGGWLSAPPCMPNYDLGAAANPCWPLSSQQLEMGNEQLVVYPNPAYGKFQIRNSKPQSVKELYNSVGQMVLSTKENEIDVSYLSKGIYYLRCENQSVKVVVE